jgi:hypothetical protein
LVEPRVVQLVPLSVQTSPAQQGRPLLPHDSQKAPLEHTRLIPTVAQAWPEATHTPVAPASPSVSQHPPPVHWAPRQHG